MSTSLTACLLSLYALLVGDRWPADVEAALVFAGANRPEIERVLTHFAAGDDDEKYDAACFLVANMPGHGYVEYGLFDEEGVEVPWSALAYPSYAAAQEAMDALEDAHGSLEFEKKALLEDLHVLTADVLIRNIDLAFAGWRDNPWSRELTFETFCEHILPHRGSNEPVEDWRGPLQAELRELLTEQGVDIGAAEVATRMGKLAAERVGFTSLYYLHPTDQGYAEMSRERRGRCEDITNMTTYAMRAAAVASAADYTPWWGHRDNNHAWPVTLDARGHGRAGDGNRAAKVYRKTYSLQRHNLAFQLEDGEEAPPWLDRKTYRDVTDQYFETTDVSVRVANDSGQRFAYLCVFNGGEWRPIHWGPVVDGAVTFSSMGRDLLYLPAFWMRGSIHPAGPPFFLTASGEVQPLDASTSATVDTDLPAKLGTEYELSVWRDGWQSLGRVVGQAGGVRRQGLPASGLFWLVAAGSRRLERPFSVRDGELRSL